MLSKIWGRVGSMFFRFILVGCLLSGLSAHVFAAEAGNGWLKNWWDEPWRFNAKVYGWLPDAPADIYVNDHQAIGLPESVETIVDSANALFMGEFEVHKGRLGLFVSPVYYDGSDKTDFRGPLGEKRKLDVQERLWLVDYGAGFDALSWNLGEGADSPTFTLTPFAGFRYFHDRIKMDVPSGAVFPGVRFRTTININTPIVGLKGYFKYNNRWSLGAEFDHGVWDDDEVNRTWQWMTMLTYHFDIKSVSSQLFLGYREVKLDIENGDVAVEVNVKGPVIGLGVSF